MTVFKLTGRVLGVDGTPRPNVTITLFARVSLTDDEIRATTETDASGVWSIVTSPATGAETLDLFVRAEHAGSQEWVDSHLISDRSIIANHSIVVDLVLGSGRFRGRSEWKRIADAVAPLLGKMAAADVPADRVEWLARRADVFPLHLGLFVQAHRLARGRPIEPSTCYALLRAGLAADLPSLLRAGASAWSAALVDAWARFVVPVPGDREAALAAALASLDELALAAALELPAAGVSRRVLLDTAGLDESEQGEFGRLWQTRQGPLVDFWASVRASATLGPSRAAALQFTIAAATLVAGHVPTLAALQHARAQGQIDVLADVARWRVAQWRTLLDDHAIDPPEQVSGSDLADRRQRYARALARLVEDSHPSAVIRHRLAADESADQAPPHTSGVSDFLSDWPDFDLTSHTPARWVVEHQGANLSEPTRANLERVQRVFRLTPRVGRYATTKVLLEQGIGSAADVVARTRDEFVRELGGLLVGGDDHDHDPFALAGRVWDNASRIHATAVSLVSSRVLGKSVMPIAGAGAKVLPQGSGLDDLAAMLGNLDFCACTDCRSVLSPAAYLADLLHFLSARPAGEFGSALAVLRARRPDLEHVLLDCPNTNTPLPRIDLVIELLERMVAGTLDASSRQTTWTADELRLAPEHVELDAYAITATQVYPAPLPFSLPVSEARGLLDSLGVTRASLLRWFGAPELEQTAESLGMLASEAAIVSGETTMDGRELWGFGPADDGWVATLAEDLPELLRRGGLSLDELRELADLTFVDPQHYGDAALTIAWSQTCALADASLAPLDAGVLSRMHRLTRLQRRTGIAPRMLSLLVDEIGGGVLDASLLARLVGVRTLQARTGLPWDEIATWWSTRIDARRYASGSASLYRRRFVGPGSDAPDSLQPTSDRGDAIVGEGGFIGPAERAVVLAACGLSEADFGRVAASPLTEGDALTFANLTKYFRAASLARVAKLGVGELLELLALTGRDPFASVADALAWFDELDAIRRARFGVASLRWLLHHEGEAAVDEAALELARAALVRALGQAEADDRPALVLDAVGRALELDETLAAALVERLAVADTLGLVTDDEAELAQQRRAWLRLGKAAVLVRAHALAADELAFFCTHGLDLAALPVAPDEPDASFADWHHFAQALALRELDVQAIASAPSFADALALATDSLAAPLDELATLAQGFGWSDPLVFVDELALAKLAAIVRAGQAIGVGPSTLATFAESSPSAATLATLRAAARAHAGSRWPSLAQPMRDRLREQQRDALVASVLATHPKIRSQDELFDHLLVDTAIAPCMTDTRILQAIASVQTFVHRVLLHLEPAVEFSTSAIAAWSWMKSYRVWEANRKVFLYPENWLDPALRRDASPLFEQLEAALQGDTLDEPNVERAVLEYLTGLDRVANLEILAVHAAHSFAPVRVLGRTQANPRAYFLRSRNAADHWQPWQEVPLSIEGDNVILLERRGRLLLFWLLVHDEGQTSGDAVSAAQRLSIAWAEQDDRGWGSTAVSERTIPLDKLEAGMPDRLILRAFNLDDEVRLIVYRQLGELGIEPRAGFRYDAVSRHVIVAGTDFDHQDHPDFLDAADCLQDPRWVGRQGGWRVEGQRFVKVQRDAQAPSEPPLCALPGDLLAADPRTHFEQGPFAALLFRRAPVTGYRGLLHQGDLWTLDAADRYAPVVYDDRQRKFLLEPRVGFVGVAIEGDAIDPAALGALDLAPYQDCAPPQVAPPLGVSPPNQAEPLMQLDVWPAKVPGPLQVPAMLAPKLLVAAQALIGQNDQPLDLAPALEFPPDAFRLRLQPLHHAHARTMLEQVALHGLAALYRPDADSPLFRQGAAFEVLGPAGLDVDPAIVAGPIPIEGFDFDPASPRGGYDWEVFVHAPLRIAAKLAADQRWADALRWLHTIFDPIDTVAGELGPSKHWRVKPLAEQAGALAVDPFEIMLGIGVTPAEQAAAIVEFQRQVAAWKKHPFDPHAIARIRPGTYARAVIRQYLDTMIAWADHLFGQDTRESIQEATTLYVRVAQLLGPRPQAVPGMPIEPKSYAQLAALGLDAFSNAAITLENWIVVPLEPAQPLGCGEDLELAPWQHESVELRAWYFCIPPNPELLAYWDIVADRLWKLRHCQNLAGVTRTLPLFDPPIDPALLVRAVAAGVDLTSAIGQLAAPLPRQRFRALLPRAVALCGEVRALGGALLSALEKRDAEALARLRSEHEVSLLAAVREVRVRQLDEARAARLTIEAAREAAEHRRAHFDRLLDAGLSEAETQQNKQLQRVRVFQQIVQSHRALAGFLSMIPQITTGPTSLDFEFGGQQISGLVHGMAAGFDSLASDFAASANKSSLTAHYARRAQDWRLQAEQAQHDLTRLDRELVVADLRIAVMQRELDNHDRQVTHAHEVDDFLRDKYATRELYDWMVRELASLHFRGYQLALELARRAERALRHELALSNSPMVLEFGHWDGLRRGLLAGEKLAHDLARLDLVHLDHDVRELELRKDFSLAALDPDALVDLRETGHCEFELPELLFDFDHPGHYLRRIRAVTLTIPAVVGPNTTVGARLVLLEHATRRNVDDAPLQFEPGGDAISTSSAVNDAGLFELDFRDERYLPFEYAGAVSRWRLDLPQGIRQFDYRTITEVGVSLAYTARDGGDAFREQVESALPQRFQQHYASGAVQLVVVHDAVPDAWRAFLAGTKSGQTLVLPSLLERFTYAMRREGIAVREVEVALVLAESVESVGQGVTLTLEFGEQSRELVLTKPGGVALAIGSSGAIEPATTPGPWTLTRTADLAPAELVDPTTQLLEPAKLAGLLLLIHFDLEG